MRYVSEKSTSNKKVANNCNHYNQNDWVYRKKIHLQTQFVWRNRSRGGSCPLAPPLAIALEWRWLLLFPTKMTLVTHKHCLVLRKSRTRSRHRGQRSLFSPMPIKNIPPTPLSPFCRPLTLTCIVCASFWSRVFLRDHLKRGLLWRKLRIDEQVNPHSHVLVQGGWGGGGGVSLSLLLSLKYIKIITKLTSTIEIYPDELFVNCKL